MLKRSMLKAPPGSKTRVVRSARSLPGATASAETVGVHPGLARLVEAALEDLLPLGVVLPRGVVEDVLLEALEGGAGRREGELDVRLQVAGRGAVEPGRGQDAADAASRAELVGPELHRDLEAVGHDRLDLERLVEGRPAHAHPARVVAGGGVGGGRHVERVEAVRRLRAAHRPHELAARVHEVEAHRVVGRDPLRGVVEDEREVHDVAGAPDPALAVEEALEALRRPGAGHVEVGDGEGGAAVEAQVAGLAAVAHRGEERRPLHRETHHAVAVGAAGGERLLLVVEERHLGARRRGRWSGGR